MQQSLEIQRFAFECKSDAEIQAGLAAGVTMPDTMQIGGKTRGTLSAPKDLSGTALEAFVRASEIVRKYVADKVIRRIVIVPGRLINVVL